MLQTGILRKDPILTGGILLIQGSVCCTDCGRHHKMVFDSLGDLHRHISRQH